LQNRELRDDVALNSTSRFADEIWVLSPAVHQVHHRNHIMNFPTIPKPFRSTAKELFYTLLTGDPPPGEPRYGLTTLRALFTGVKYFLYWADLAGYATLQSIAPEQLAQYQTWMLSCHFSPHRRGINRRAARLFWLYRDLLPSDRLTHDPRRLTNWAKDSKRHPDGGENKTDRIPEQVVSPLLVWAFRWVDDFSTDIIAARREWWQLHANGVSTNCRSGRSKQPEPQTTRHGSPVRALEALLNEYRAAGRPLPGIGDGTVNRMFLARQLCRRHPFLLNRPAREIIAAAADELGVSDASYLLTEVNAILDGQPWLSAFTFAEMPHMSRLLQAACYVVIAYLSGMRDSEIKHLRRGCITHKRDNDGRVYRHLITSRAFKGEGTPTGVTATWIVSPPVGRAVAVLEQLQPSDEPYLFNTLRGSPTYRRPGRATTTTTTIRSMNAFVDWINDYCAAHNRHDNIPLVRGQRWKLCTSQFRRTLAWFIARRPGGSIAGAIQYRHHGIQMFEGYAGTSDSGFRAEVEAEQTLERGEHLFALIENHEHHDLRGPAADQAQARLDNLARKTAYSGSIITDPKRLGRIMRRDDPKIYPGRFVTCVYDPRKALCRRQHTAGGEGLMPDLGSCQPLRCNNVALSAENRAALADHLHRLDTHLRIADVLPPYVAHRLSEQRKDLAAMLKMAGTPQKNR
jgi:integrase